MASLLERQWYEAAYRHHSGKILAAGALLFLFIGYVIAGGLSGSDRSPDNGGGTGTPITQTAAGPSMWTCSMHPQIRQPNPGSCPICGMDLIPVATNSAGLRTLRIGPETRALLSIASTPVQRRYVSHEISMVGKVDFDETKFGYITAWVPGRLDRLYVDYTGVQVNQGDHMAFIYSPALYSAQEELIQALKFRTERPSTTRLPSLDLVESAREKLRLLGLTEEQVKQIEQQEKPSDHLTTYSPISGVVIEKLKKEGEYVKTGDRIYTVADLNQVWVHLDAYESDLMWVRYGQDVTIITEAYPGEEFHGRIAFIQPVLNDRTRTVKVRVNVPNANGKLKPDMFVHAVVRPKIAAGGRVMDASLAGKWISPMHPEIVKDEPGKCDICGMPLVRAESLGFVKPETDSAAPPLVIPYSAALVTGRRAVVYVELPPLPGHLEPAFQALQSGLKGNDSQQARDALAAFGKALDQPNDQTGTAYARQLWNGYADQLAKLALEGTRAQSSEERTSVFARIETVVDRVREDFSPSDQPTFEGREIVLGPRAGNFYLVRNGLAEGELVVTQGNFKIDAEIQIQAKPSMMTPSGGGGGGHDHGGSGGKPSADDPLSGHAASLPPEFLEQFRQLEARYDQVAAAIEQKDVGKATTAFAQLSQAIDAVDRELLSGHLRMQWKEFAMLLSNDAVEGRDATQLAEADRVFLLLKGHMRRLREQLGVMPVEANQVRSIAVTADFQRELAAVWERYLAIQQQLAADHFEPAQQGLTSLRTAITTVNDSTLTPAAKEVWQTERQNLLKLVESLEQSQEIKAMRTQFKPLSEEIGVLAKTFGFGEAGPIFELHCPMAFQGNGALWYQGSEQVQNPYFGTSMLTCADQVKKIIRDDPATTNDASEASAHSQH